MGYTTDFEGEFKLNTDLDNKTRVFLNKLNATRRMKRDVSKLPSTGFERYGFTSWGEEGEFFVDESGSFGQDRGPSVLDYNRKPCTQPGLWCQWVPNEEATAIVWDGGEKFYSYVEWLQYIIDKVLAPRGYILNGEMTYQGEEASDFGKIVVTDNKIKRLVGKRTYEESFEEA